MQYEDHVRETICQRNLGEHSKQRRRPRKKRRAVLERDGFQCVQCSMTDVEELTMDHIWPRSRRGCNCLENLQTMCVGCNQSKANSFEFEDSTGVIRGHPRGHCPRA